MLLAFCGVVTIALSKILGHQNIDEEDDNEHEEESGESSLITNIQ